MPPLKGNNRGFTLIEMLISMAVFGFTMATMVVSYQAQMRSYYDNREIADMQQNLRSALYLMSREIKLAGIDPTGDADAKIITADTHRIEFSMDYTGGQNDLEDNDDDGAVDEGGNVAEWYDGDSDDDSELIAYFLSNDNDPDGEDLPYGDGLNDGLPTQNDDGSACHLIRDNKNAASDPQQPVAFNIDALYFEYFDEDGTVMATPVANTSKIRSIQISIVARTNADASAFGRNYTNEQVFYNQAGTIQFFPRQNDSARRVMMSTAINCRNIGLN